MKMIAPLPSSSTLERVWAALIALLLGYFFVLAPIQGLWRDHWLVKDGQEGVGVVTSEHWGGHGIVVYQYRVEQKEYTGQDHRSLQDVRYAHVIPGGKTVVYFSTSHPWLSAINLPQSVTIPGLPVVLLAWLIEVGLIITVIDPKSRGAFNFSGQQTPFAAKEVAGNARSRSQSPARAPILDKLLLVGSAVLIVLAMAAIELGIDALWGRR